MVVDGAPRRLNEPEFWAITNDLRGGKNASINEIALLASIDHIHHFFSPSSLSLLRALEETPHSLQFTAEIIDKLSPAIMNASREDRTVYLRTLRILQRATTMELDQHRRTRRPLFNSDAKEEWDRRLDQLQWISESLQFNASENSDF